MRIVCIKCGCVFAPEEKFHVLCGEGENNCVGQVDIYGSGAMLRAASYLVNAKLNEEEIDLLSDSPAFLKLMSELIVRKPPEQFKNFLGQLMKEIH